MTLRQHFRSDGSPKAAFPDQATALDVADRWRDSGRLNAYECSVCGKWHLGAQR